MCHGNKVGWRTQSWQQISSVFPLLSELRDNAGQPCTPHDWVCNGNKVGWRMQSWQPISSAFPLPSELRDDAGNPAICRTCYCTISTGCSEMLKFWLAEEADKFSFDLWRILKTSDFLAVTRCRREKRFTWVSAEVTLFGLFQLFVGGKLRIKYTLILVQFGSRSIRLKLT